MVELKILSNNNSGTVHRLNRFPARVGRSPAADVRLESPGVWDQHLQIDLKPAEGFHLTVLPGAWALLNGQEIKEGTLRNGDSIELGGVKILFWFSETRQRSLRWRESLTWIALGLLALVQILIIYRLLQV
jgi:pSer/pThr/pTyr-binding forkhead associated (FHA) protein